MPVLTDFKISLTNDQILAAQGADPHTVAGRRPQLVEIAGQALALGLPLVQPVVAYRELTVEAVSHERLLLAGGLRLSGKRISALLVQARQVVALTATIGSGVETLASSLLPADPPLGLALDAVGTAAVESLSQAACAFFGSQATAQGWHATLPLSPGMEGWPAGPGQAEIFAILPPAEAGVSLTSSGMLLPQKSLSWVLGLGPEVDPSGRVCDYCNLSNTCRYQEKHA